jgi:hypothetical protein
VSVYRYGEEGMLALGEVERFCPLGDASNLVLRSALFEEWLQDWLESDLQVIATAISPALSWWVFSGGTRTDEEGRVGQGGVVLG